MTIPELEDPIALFRMWLADAEQSETINPNAMAIATVGQDGTPSIRTVLLKDVDATGGFIFYTNLTSQKGRELKDNPRAAACFYWRALERQVRVEGTTTLVGDSEADAYFASRPRGSQIGALVSDQSATLDDRAILQSAFDAAVTRYEGSDVLRPADWSGYRLMPARIEFWHSKPSRLHDRLLYDRNGADWTRRWLYP